LRTISILTVFDTEKILKSGTSLDIVNPVKVKPGSLYMIAGDKDTVDAQASGDLVIQAKVGDVLSWRASSLSGNTSESVFFHGFKAHVPGVFTPPLPGVLDADLIKNTWTDSISAHWSAVVIGSKNTLYTFYFTILYKDENGYLMPSYYVWEGAPTE